MESSWSFLKFYYDNSISCFDDSISCFEKMAELLEENEKHFVEEVRGCSFMMSAYFWPFWTPPSLPLANVWFCGPLPPPCQILTTPPPNTQWNFPLIWSEGMEVQGIVPFPVWMIPFPVLNICLELFKKHWKKEVFHSMPCKWAK